MNGTKVDVYSLTNRHGILCEVITYGSTITRLEFPDRQGNRDDVVLGYADLRSYEKACDYAGATIGRVANRIQAGRLQINGRHFQLSCNEGSHHLHGGFRGFDKAVWEVTDVSQVDGRLSLSHTSPDGAEGYPGQLKAKVTYTLTDDDELWMEYSAASDQPTPVNLTNHTYFNLAGKGNILNHWLSLDASRYTPLDHAHIPTGTIIPVKGTAIDFSVPSRIGERQSRLADGVHGLNYSYVLNNGDGLLSFAARLHDPDSGRVLELLTDQPALQLYTGSYLRSFPPGKHGAIYGPNSGLCLEAQRFPDAVNCARFPSIILQPEEKYQHKTIWKFSIA